jgi:HAD superfamily hydrolase (TIGR01509 family)
MDKNLKGIIFDFDGTLINSLSEAATSFHHAIAAVGERPRTIEDIKKHFGRGADQILIQVLEDQEKGRLAFEHYKEHQREAAPLVHLHEGIAELLNKIMSEKVPTAIVTGRHTDDLEIMIARHKIRERFIAIVCDNNVSNPKPHPDGLHLALEKMGLKPFEAMYVGDSPMDVLAALAAGCTAVAALWDGLAERQHFAAHPPHLYAEKPSQLWDYFSARRSSC